MVLLCILSGASLMGSGAYLADVKKMENFGVILYIAGIFLAVGGIQIFS